MRSWKFSAILFTMLLAGCASWQQPDSQVWRRLSGETLQPWLSVQQAALLHWPYAWAATAAYQDADDPHRKPLDTSVHCPEPHAFLAAHGWTRWDKLPLLQKTKGEPAPASEQMRRAHLRAEVWSNASEQQVIVAFGGTAVSSLEDWKANMRWFLAPFHAHDQYDVLTDDFVPLFIHEYKRRSQVPGGEWLATARIAATGHSLGGGLAQRFAYSLRRDLGVPGVSQVFAFDPSPVSGKRSVSDFKNQAKGLTIYRIYNRGEILASVRSLLQLSNKNNLREQGQTWIDIRYKDHWTWRTLLPSGSVYAHGMFDLACSIKQHLPADLGSQLRNPLAARQQRQAGQYIDQGQRSGQRAMEILSK